MKREQEILKAYNEQQTKLGNQEHTFMRGAKWADAHNEGLNMHIKYLKEELIDKACEWLDCYIDNYLFIDAENKAGIKWNDFINAFRKAMKSGCSEKPNNCEKGGEE